MQWSRYDDCQYTSRRQERCKTYIAAKPMIPLTMTFTRRFICRSFTTKIGRIPNVQSANEFSADTAYVKYMTSDAERHSPW